MTYNVLMGKLNPTHSLMPCTLYVRAAALILVNGLLLNPTKSEVAFFGTKQRLQRVTLPASVTVAGSSVTVNGVLKILGVTLDSTLTFDDHVNNVVRSCNYHLAAKLCNN